MAFWPFVRSEEDGARLARPGDRAALTSLLARTWRRHGSAALEDQTELLCSGLSTISRAGADARGFLGLRLRAPAGKPPQAWVDLNLAAVEPDGRSDGVLADLVKAAIPLLQLEDAAGVVCLAPSGWLEDGLGRAGFVREDRVLTYAHGYSRQLEKVAGPAKARPAHAADTRAILEINAQAFGPFWQYDDSVVMGWMLTSDHVLVAEIDGSIAGFAITSIGVGQSHAHLIRVATHPRFQGRGIGRQLVIDAVEYAKGSGAAGLALNTQASNQISRNLYESLGFRQTGHWLAVMVYRLRTAGGSR